MDYPNTSSNDTKMAAYEAVHCWGEMMVAALSFHPPVTQVVGKFTWAHYQIQLRPVANFSTVLTKRGANVSR